MIKEVCICAAAKTTDGLILRGHRHRDCLHAMARRRLKPAKEFEAQGFITSKNRYVDRVEGYRLQQLANIDTVNPQGYTPPGWLFSEDLY